MTQQRSHLIGDACGPYIACCLLAGFVGWPWFVFHGLLAAAIGFLWISFICFIMLGMVVTARKRMRERNSHEDHLPVRGESVQAGDAPAHGPPAGRRERGVGPPGP